MNGRIRAGAIVAATMVAGLTCKDLVGVSPETAIRFVLGTTAGGEVEDANEPRYYEIAVKADSSYAILVEALEGAVLVRVRSPAGFLTGVTVSAPSGPLERHSTGIFTPVYDAHWLVVVQPASTGPPSRFRMRYEPVRRDPESLAAQIALGDTVTGETLSSVADIDEFEFAGQAGQELNAFLEALGPHQSGPIILRVFSSGGGPQLEGVTDTAGDSDLELSASGRFLIPQSGSHRVVVGPAPFAGPYRFQLYPIHRAPETFAASVVFGDTIVGEAIDHVGDIDEFTFVGADSQQVYVFLQGRTGQATDRFVASLPGIADETYGFPLQSVGTDTSLFSQFLGPFTLLGGGARTLRVAGTWRGPYRALVHTVDLAPETAASSLAPGDSLNAEAIGTFGDVDRFSITIPTDTLANLVVLPQPGTPGGVLTARLTHVLGGLGVTVAVSDTAAYAASGGLSLGSGSYRLEVSANNIRYRGAYALWLPVFSRAPEAVPDTIVLGDTIVGEALGTPGDRDEFWVFGRVGQHWNVQFQGLSGVSNGNLVLSVGPGPYGSVGLSSTGTSPSLDLVQSNRVDILRTGWLKVQVRAADDGTQLNELGAYRFVIDSMGDSPESSSVSLVVGDSVSERIDFPGDFDRYSLVGSPGEEVTIAYKGVPLLVAADSGSPDTLSSTYGRGGWDLLRDIKLPASGRRGISVYQPRLTYSCGDPVCSGAYDWQGPYQFMSFHVNRHPESAPDTIAVGDTVRGEGIGSVGDLDEFTVQATPGAMATAWFRITQDVTASGYMWFQLYNRTTGEYLNSIALWVASPGFSSLQVQVPAGGLGVRAGSQEFGLAPYEFFVTSP